MKYKNRVFTPNDRIDLDGAEMEGCDFGGCTLFYKGGQPPTLVNNRGLAPRIVFEGPAANTVALMKALSQGGFASIVRATFPGLFAN